PQPQHLPPFQPPGQTGRQRPAQVGAVHLRRPDVPAGHHRLQSAADGLDLGQFGHGHLPGGAPAKPPHCGGGGRPYKKGKFHGGGKGPMQARTTHFGSREVPEDEKAGLVHGVFSSVASRYDLMNDLMSAGIHRLWKDAMMDWLAPRPGQRLLDVAGGTGDIAFRFLRRAPGATATVLDMTEPMLVEGQKRAEAERLADRLSWVVGDAMALPFPDNTFDVY